MCFVTLSISSVAIEKASAILVLVWSHRWKSMSAYVYVCLWRLCPVAIICLPFCLYQTAWIIFLPFCNTH